MNAPQDSVYFQQFEIVGGDFTLGGQVATKIKKILKEIGIDSSIIRRTVIAVYEAEMNIIMYARKGMLNLMVMPSEIDVIIFDEGQGIPDIELALQEGYSTASIEMQEMGFGAGMGLPNIKKNVDYFYIQSEVGVGSRLYISIII